MARIAKAANHLIMHFALMLKKIGISLLIFGIVILGGFVVLPGFLKEQLKNKIIAELDYNLNATIHFGNYHVSSFLDFPNIDIQLHDFLVCSAFGHRGDTLAYAKKVTLIFDFWSVYNTEKIDIKGVFLLKPKVYLTVDASGRNNFDIFKSYNTQENPQDSSQFNLKIEKWQIEDGYLEYADPSKKHYILLAGLSHEGSGSFTKTNDLLKTQTVLKEGYIKWNNLWYFKKKPVRILVNAQMNRVDSTYSITQNTVTIGHCDFELKGMLKQLRKGFFTDLTFTLKETSLKELFTLIPGVYKKNIQEYHASGNISLGGFIKGTFIPEQNVLPMYQVKLHIENGNIRHPLVLASVAGLHMDLLFENLHQTDDSMHVFIPKFSVLLDKHPIMGHIRLWGAKNPYVIAEIDANCELEVLERLFKLDSVNAKGNLDLAVYAKGFFNPDKKLFPYVSARMNLKKGIYKNKNLPFVVENIHCVANISNSTGKYPDTEILIDTLSYLIDNEPFVVSGTLRDLTRYKFELDIRGLLDFAKITKIFPLEHTTLSGTLLTKLNASGTLDDILKKNYQKIDLSGTALVNQFRYHHSEFNHKVYVPYAMFRFNPATIKVERFEGTLGSSTIAAKGEIGHYLPYIFSKNESLTLKFELHCDSLNLNEWFLKPEKPDTNQKISVYRLPNDLEIKLKTNINRLIFDQMEIDNLRGDLSLKNQVLKLNEVRFNSLGSDFKLNLVYNTQDSTRPQFAIDELFIKDLDVNKAYEAFYTVQNTAPAAQHTSGVFSINYKLRGTLQPDMKPDMKSLRGGGIVFIKKAQINGMKMFDHISSLTKKEELKNPDVSNLMLVSEIEQGKLIIRPFRFKINKYDAELEGYHEFEGNMAYRMKIGIPPFEKTKIPLQIEGTYQKPRIRLGKGHSLDSLHKLQ